MTNPNFKHYPLPPEGIEVMRRYADTIEKLSSDREALQVEYVARAEAMQVSAREQLRDLWYQMAAMVGVDADASWDSASWFVEAQYIDSGFAALTFRPQPRDPLAALLGGEDGAPSSGVASVSKGKVLN